jgi:hypothetical protein
MSRVSAHQRDFSNKPLGYRPASDKKHIELFPLRAVDLRGAQRPKSKEHAIGYRYDQGQEGACVGMACAAFASYWNLRRSRLDADKRHYEAFQFDAMFVYNTAKREYDEWPGEDYDGTSTRAGLEVLRNEGVAAVKHPDHVVKIQEYRWATSLEDILNYVAFVGPTVFGLNWYQNFDRPQKGNFPGSSTSYYFIGKGDLGSVRGGHDIICNGYRRASDGTEWLRLQNSWGYSYPLVWLPAQLVGDLLTKGELEAGMITAFPFNV